MGSHPINLALRFLLELTALIAFGMWGWEYGSIHAPWIGNLLAVSLPILAAVLWGVFNVPQDPSRSGKAPVVVAGLVRLFLEMVFFIVATLCLYNLGYNYLFWIFGVIVVLHYLFSYDRVIWLIER